MPAAAAPPRQMLLPFEEGPVWELVDLESRLRQESGRDVNVVLTENRSVLLSFRRAADRVTLRLHRMFLHAPMSVVCALARSLRRVNRRAEVEVRRFMNDNLHRVRRAPKVLPPIVSRGRTYDLDAIFQRVNSLFFGGALAAPITWGRGGGQARRGGLTFGSYDPVMGLIRIHPVLDRSEVPIYFVESVVYHEMLHHHMGGVRDRAGRTVYHTRAFREAEARYPLHREALAWEKANLPYLVRATQALRRSRRVSGRP